MKEYSHTWKAHEQKDAPKAAPVAKQVESVEESVQETEQNNSPNMWPGKEKDFEVENLWGDT